MNALLPKTGSDQPKIGPIPSGLPSEAVPAFQPSARGRQKKGGSGIDREAA
ncbi:MAG: hypothetical protein N2423_09295 [Novosphingobium sp.]|nr:hypothetical protein [Novosphingobium sp.]